MTLPIDLYLIVRTVSYKQRRKKATNVIQYYFQSEHKSGFEEHYKTKHLGHEHIFTRKEAAGIIAGIDNALGQIRNGTLAVQRLAFSEALAEADAIDMLREGIVDTKKLTAADIDALRTRW